MKQKRDGNLDKMIYLAISQSSTVSNFKLKDNGICLILT